MWNVIVDVKALSASRSLTMGRHESQLAVEKRRTFPITNQGQSTQGLSLVLFPMTKGSLSSPKKLTVVLIAPPVLSRMTCV